jgi:hypothetical protein
MPIAFPERRFRERRGLGDAAALLR